MPTEAVFYADLLGFSELPMSAAITALEDLATALQRHHWGGKEHAGWKGRYGLGDCIFLTHADPVWALSEAVELVANLATLTLGSEFPVLLRGALAFGETQHLASVFAPERREAVNLAGQAVVEAVRLAEAPRPQGRQGSRGTALNRRAPRLSRSLTRMDREPVPLTLRKPRNDAPRLARALPVWATPLRAGCRRFRVLTAGASSTRPSRHRQRRATPRPAASLAMPRRAFARR
jgi:hypothetical protein